MTHPSTQRAHRNRERAARRHEARGHRHPRLGCRSRQALLQQAGLEARRRLRRRRPFPGRAVHASGLAGLDPLRQGSDVGRARLGERALSSSCPTSRRRAPISSAAVSTWAKSSTRRSGTSADPRPGSGAAQLLSYAAFKDPDGNTWLLQEVTVRFPDGWTRTRRRSLRWPISRPRFRRAEAAHGEHEKRTGVRDANWPDWYAEYMAAEQAGQGAAAINRDAASRPT